MPKPTKAKRISFLTAMENLGDKVSGILKGFVCPKCGRRVRGEKFYYRAIDGSDTQYRAHCISKRCGWSRNKSAYELS